VAPVLFELAHGDWLGDEEAREAVERAVISLIEEGKVRT
jgi:hypothetical protein